MDFEVLEFAGADARKSDTLIAVAAAVFEDFDGRYITARIDQITDPLLLVARQDDRWIGFKIGYRQGQTFYSWLGGTIPGARGRGVARRLMQAQHAAAAARGFCSVETRTRASNTPMIILNLRSGFEIIGFEVDRDGIPVVTQRKRLTP